MPNSLLPLPNPLTTSPRQKYGKQLASKSERIFSHQKIRQRRQKFVYTCIRSNSYARVSRRVLKCKSADQIAWRAKRACEGGWKKLIAQQKKEWGISDGMLWNKQEVKSVWLTAYSMLPLKISQVLSYVCESQKMVQITVMPWMVFFNDKDNMTGSRPWCKFRNKLNNPCFYKTILKFL